DHNQLVMDTLQKVANRHDLVCLLHEKPFAGVNGSGKHNNWSLSTECANLLSPGKTPHSNAQFMTFLAAIIAAVDEYAPLLRLSAASAGNDHRLGANEAPPAIISIFLGEQLTEIIDQIKDGVLTSSREASTMKLGVTTLPEFPKDVTDRNRTSPFAFTGNRFEFRMVGSAQSISGPNIVINTIMAEILGRIADELEPVAKEQFEAKLNEIIERLIKKHYRIIFNGDGYSKDWVVEAEKRGLPNIKAAVEALHLFNDPSYIAMFEKHGVFTAGEVEARREIMLDEYSKTINIEAQVAIEMVKKEIIPAVIDYVANISDAMNSTKAAVPQANVSVQENLVIKISDKLADVQMKLNDLEDKLAKTHEIEDVLEEARAFKYDVFEAMQALRVPCDELETLVAQDFWPFPTYSDLLFRV
ncbi:MAG: glutamine synthetase type III, partial [Vallitaleaceae bacterium]|nr:glutamine synthetase type III [Vallitaleaceae bacterium]